MLFMRGTTALVLMVLFLGLPAILWADAGDATVYEVQQGVYAQYTWVTIDSVVVTAVAPTGFWIEEPAGGAYSGIYVNRGDTPPVTRLDLVTVSGYYLESGGVSIINATTAAGGIIDDLAPNQTEPSPEALTVGDINTGSPTAEQWEGVLVVLDTVECVTVNGGEWEAAEADGDAPGETLFVDDMMSYTGPSVGDSLVLLRGVLHYLSGDFRLEPRDNYDVQVFDNTPPGQITDLSASPGEYNGTVDLSWTATGDDGSTGTASGYIVRYHTSPITEANWDAATDVSGEPAPQPSGTPESWTAQSLPSGATVYMAIRAEDEAAQLGPVSNSPSVQVADSQPKLEIHCINVGQGDATLIVSGAGKSFLFDGGWNGQGNSVVIPYLQALGLDSLTYMGASHYDADHIGGLDEVFDNFGVREECWDRGWTYTTASYYDYVGAIGAQRTTITDGTVIDMGDGVTITCVGVNGNGLLSPPYDYTQWSENDLCVNLIVEVGNFQFYVGGDTPGYSWCTPYHDIETSIGSEVGDVEVVHANHHGSYCNTNQNLVNAMSPEAAIISVGDGNSYGHPTQEVINRLFLADAYIYQTEQGDGGTIPLGHGEIAGDIVIRTNGVCTYTIQDSIYLVDNATDVEIAGAVPSLFRLHPNVPNPFNPATTVRFELPESGPATLAVYDVAGRVVAVLSNGSLSAGPHTETWNGKDQRGRDVGSGVYFLRLEANRLSATQKMTLIR